MSEEEQAWRNCVVADLKKLRGQIKGLELTILWLVALGIAWRLQWP